MEPYICIGSLFILGEILINLKSKYYNIIGKYLILFLFFFVAGLSYKIHNDFQIYEMLYKYININNIQKIIFNYNIKEFGFLYLNILFNNILSFECFKAFVYLINTFLIYKGIRYFFNEKDSLFILALLYLYGVFYFFYLPSFRQSISISIFIYSLQYLEKKDAFRYFLLSFIACLFHKSGVILFCLYFIFKYLKTSKKLLSIFYVLSIIIYYFLDSFCLKILNIIINFLGKFYPEFLSNKLYFGLNCIGSPREFIFYLLIFGTIIFYYSEKEDFFIKGYLFFHMFYILQKYISISYRIILYFQIFFIFYLVILLQKISKEKVKVFFKYGLLLFIFLNFNIRFMLKHSLEGSYIPFHSSVELFYKEIPYEETAEYIHVQNRGKNPKDFIKRKTKNKGECNKKLTLIMMITKLNSRFSKK